MTNSIPRVSSQQLDADIDTFRALTGMADYKAHNPDFSLASAEGALSALNQAETALTLAEAARATARSNALLARAEFHRIILGVKDEAMVIYGADSDQIAALGLKKKSERNRPRRVAKPAVSS